MVELMMLLFLFGEEKTGSQVEVAGTTSSGGTGTSRSERATISESGQTREGGQDWEEEGIAVAER